MEEGIKTKWVCNHSSWSISAWCLGSSHWESHYQARCFFSLISVVVVEAHIELPLLELAQAYASWMHCCMGKVYSYDTWSCPDVQDCHRRQTESSTPCGMTCGNKEAHNLLNSMFACLPRCISPVLVWTNLTTIHQSVMPWDLWLLQKGEHVTISASKIGNLADWRVINDVETSKQSKMNIWSLIQPQVSQGFNGASNAYHNTTWVSCIRDLFHDATLL